MHLKSQATVQFPLDSDSTKRLFIETDNFHESDLDYVQSMRSSDMKVGIRILHWAFLNDSCEIDQLSTLHFKFAKPVFLDRWGDDGKICECIIYDFLMHDESFNVLTGDGGRKGTYSSSGSHVTLVTTPEVLEHLGLV